MNVTHKRMDNPAYHHIDRCIEWCQIPKSANIWQQIYLQKKKLGAVEAAVVPIRHPDSIFYAIEKKNITIFLYVWINLKSLLLYTFSLQGVFSVFQGGTDRQIDVII